MRRRKPGVAARLLGPLIDRFGDWLTRARLRREKSGDIYQARRGGYTYFWPISVEAKRVMANALANFPKRRGGYRSSNAQANEVHRTLRDNCGLRITSYSPMLGASITIYPS